jgi:two-component system osmolarity sensor histidine kinase EnvZ
LNALVKNAVARYARSNRSVRFQPGPVSPLALRPMAVQRLIANLIDNALRHGNGEVDVLTHEENGCAIAEVLDRGPGIPAEAAERMLQPFTRLDAARGGSGTGLGLAIVDRIAGMHGGAVKLLPREGGGLRARVELPLQPLRHAASVQAASG